MTRGLTIQVLHTEGCTPGSFEITRRTLEQALAEVGLVGLPVEDVLIDSEEQSRAYGMVGGPAVMVNGVDVDPAVRGMRPGGLGCRAYVTPEGISSAPPLSMIVAALREAMSSG